MSIVDALSAYRVYPPPASRHALLVSLGPSAPQGAHVCRGPAPTTSPRVQATAGTAWAHTRPALPGLGCAAAARHRAVRVRPAPLSPTGLGARSTSGGQGSTPKTNHSTQT